MLKAFDWQLFLFGSRPNLGVVNIALLMILSKNETVEFIHGF